MLMCLAHWEAVPAPIQRRIRAAYRRGQERDKRPSPAYMAAHHSAVESVARAEGRDVAEYHAKQAKAWSERAAALRGGK